jgi:hypothetical protein
MSENKNAKTPAANRAMTLEEVQQWITTTWLRCQDEVWRQDVTPPKKEWVGLTAYEIQEIHLKNPHWGNFACAIEAKLKEKNHG